MKIKVIHVVQQLLPGGIENLVLEMARASSNDIESSIVSLALDKQTATATWPQLKDHSSANLFFLEKTNGLKPSLVKTLYSLFKELCPDVVHVHGFGPLIYAGLAARISRINKIVYTVHNAWEYADKKKSKMTSFVIKALHPIIIADSKNVAENIAKHLNIPIPKVIHNGIDTNKFCMGNLRNARIQLNLPCDKTIIGCAARLAPVKGHEYLLNAMKLLDDDIHLALAGDGPIKTQLVRQSCDEKLKDRIHFLGNVKSMPTFYQAIDLFCLPSLHEGMPLAPLEAQACGVRTVATYVGGCHESVCPITGILVEPRNHTKLAAALSQQIRSQKKQTPRKFIEDLRNINDMILAYKQYY